MKGTMPMYSLKEQKGPTLGTAPKPTVSPVRSIRRRRQLQPFFFRMGPVALCITSVLLMGLMAVLYLSQVGQAVSANQKLQDMRSEQAALQRQNQDLVNVIAQEQSPDYIAQNARKFGLVPADPKDVQVVEAHNLKPIPKQKQTIQP